MRLPPSMPDSLIQRLQSHAANAPDQLLLGYENSAPLTASFLLERAERLANELRQAGLQRKRVVLLFPSCPEFIIAYLGTLMAEAVAVPLPWTRNARGWERISPSLLNAEPSLLLTTPTHGEHLAALWRTTFPDRLTPVWTLDATADSEPSVAAVTEHPAPSASDSFPELAMIQYTSGSTGAPKGVCLTHANLSHNLAAIEQAFEHGRESRGVIWLPHHHDMGLIGGLLSPLYTGFRVDLMPPLNFVKHPVRWLQAISHNQATSSGGPNFAYDHCVRAWERMKPSARPELDLRTWQIAFIGAEPVRASTLDRFIETFAPHGFDGRAFYPCYGLAESTLMATGGPRLTGHRTLRVDADALAERRLHPIVQNRDKPARTFVSAGTIVDPETQLQILPPLPEQCSVTEGAIGEISLSGPSISPGYWTDLKQGSDRESNRILRTGDLGCLIEGHLYVVGRIRDLIIIDGRNYDPADLEFTTQNAHPALEAVRHCAFAVDSGREEHPVMIAEVDPRWRHTDPGEITTAIRRACSQQHGIAVTTIRLVPRGTVRVTTSGKVRRSATREQYLSDALPQFLFRNSKPLTQSPDESRMPALQS